ncbi:MAG TPA: alcohol dehydrogenase [Desulfotomaculum sp.]|nr:alcohol dehydrogenase [Desulfotomaculum sp.]
MIIIKALFLRDNKVLSLEDTEKPVIKEPGDVIVKVTASAICGSDIHFWQGGLPCIPDFILGHEFVGTIEEAGSGVKLFKPGDRVSVPANPYCGVCPNCKEGKVYICEMRSMFGGGKLLGDLPGAQAEYVRVPSADNCLAPIPDTVSDRAALLVGDVLSTGYFAALNGNLRPGDDIAIFGAGPVGLCALACALLFSPARVFLVDVEDYRLEVGLKMGATHIINTGSSRAAKEIKRLTGGRGVDLVIEAVGLPATFCDAVSSAAPGGVVSLVGIGPPVMEFPMAKFFFKNLTLKAGLVPLTNMSRLMKLIEAGRLDVTPLFTHRIKLSNILEGYRIFKDKEDNCIKVLVVPD